MRFEVSQRLDTSRVRDEIITLAAQKIRKVANNVFVSDDDEITATGIEATFASALRRDTTTIWLQQSDDAWLLIADIEYRPSSWFWIVFVLSLFTWILWLIPLVLYFHQKSIVREAVKNCLDQVANRMPAYPPAAAPPRLSPVEELEHFAGLKERGFITEEEFAAQKARLLPS